MHKLHGETSVDFQEGKLFKQNLQSMSILISEEFFNWFLMAVLCKISQSLQELSNQDKYVGRMVCLNQFT